jgi:hypothetical protein
LHLNLKSFLYENHEGKMTLAMSLVNPPPDEMTLSTSDHPLSNSVALQPLIDWQSRDDQQCWFSSSIVCSVIFGDRKTKEVMSGMYAQQMKRRLNPSQLSPGEDDDDDDTVTMVQAIAHTLVFSSRAQAVVRSQVALLSVLCCWIWGCKEAAAELLNDVTILQYVR